MSATRLSMRFWFYCLLSVVFGIVLYGWWHASGGSALAAPGARLIAIGRLFGLIATVCILLEFFLMSRTPLIEQNFDLHEYIDLHRLNGYGILLSIAGHIAFLTLGYANPSHVGILRQFLNFTTGYEDVLNALLGTIVFFVATALSVYAIRKHLRYELWYVIHLTMYGAILLAFGHQLKVGGDFSSQRWFVAFWYALYIGVFGVLGYYRFLRPAILYYRHRFVVQKVAQEAKGIYSLYITGKQMADFTFNPGQYATWRIISRDLLLEGHPFSFSSAPGQDTVRLTFKAGSGDFSRRLIAAQPGTPVIIDGPRGSFTHNRATSDNVVCIAGGIGVSPYLSMADHLLKQGKHVTLMYAARNADEVAFRKELATLQQHGLDVKLFISSTGKYIDKTVLQPYAQDNAMFYLCGPTAMSTQLQDTLLNLGMRPGQIVSERFAF